MFIDTQDPILTPGNNAGEFALPNQTGNIANQASEYLQSNPVASQAEDYLRTISSQNENMNEVHTSTYHQQESEALIPTNDLTREELQQIGAYTAAIIDFRDMRTGMMLESKSAPLQPGRRKSIFGFMLQPFKIAFGMEEGR